MTDKSVRVRREVHEILKTYSRNDESIGDFIQRSVIFYIENSGDIYLPRHQIIKAMIIEDPEELKGQVAVDIQTVDHDGKELGRNWVFYESVDDAIDDQLPSTKGLEVFEKLKD